MDNGGEDSNAITMSNRETQVLKLLVQGMSNKEMANELGVSIETVKSHMKNILIKLSASTRTQAVVKALKTGLYE